MENGFKFLSGAEQVSASVCNSSFFDHLQDLDFVLTVKACMHDSYVLPCTSLVLRPLSEGV